MTRAEAMVLALVVALCVAVSAVRRTLPDWAKGYLAALALVACLAVVFRRCSGWRPRADGDAPHRVGAAFPARPGTRGAPPRAGPGRPCRAREHATLWGLVRLR